MITKLEAFSFLKKHQPMSSDDEMTKQEIDKYDEVREFFLNNVDEQCIPLFLNSFGGRDGFGVYQMVEDVINVLKDEIERIFDEEVKKFAEEVLEDIHNSSKS